MCIRDRLRTYCTGYTENLLYWLYWELTENLLRTYCSAENTLTLSQTKNRSVSPELVFPVYCGRTGTAPRAAAVDACHTRHAPTLGFSGARRLELCDTQRTRWEGTVKERGLSKNWSKIVKTTASKEIGNNLILIVTSMQQSSNTVRSGSKRGYRIKDRGTRKIYIE